MIQLPQGFKINAKEPIDVRLILSKADMLVVKESTMPDVYFAICKDDGKMYIYSKENEFDEVTGKYRLYGGGGSTSSTVEVSKEEGNRLMEKEDGLYVSDNEPIPEVTIRNLFLDEKSEDKQ